ncbi:hypothetical protein AB4428_11750 [Vibrio lentus]
MTSSNQALTDITHHNQLADHIIKSVTIPRQLKTVLVAIATFYNLVNDNAFPTRKELAKRTGYSINYITYLIAYACREGFLVSTPRFIKGERDSAPRQSSNNYRIILSAIGARFSKVKAMLNKNLRQKKKEDEMQELLRNERVDHANQLLGEAPVSEQPYIDTYEWEGYEPPK